MRQKGYTMAKAKKTAKKGTTKATKTKARKSPSKPKGKPDTLAILIAISARGKDGGKDILKNAFPEWSKGSLMTALRHGLLGNPPFPTTKAYATCKANWDAGITQWIDCDKRKEAGEPAGKGSAHHADRTAAGDLLIGSCRSASRIMAAQ